ncbi:MAG TPA: xanthine phosphoribosyltransferase [Methanomicrobia archaeon]|nr:xanthine phosphoribosyltransferase [Methanomicrobia archaeon]
MGPTRTHQHAYHQRARGCRLGVILHLPQTTPDDRTVLGVHMESLKDAIRERGVVLSERILIVNSFLNHQVDTVLLDEIGRAFAGIFKECAPTKVMTAAVSGIPPALATGLHLGIPVIYARKTRPSTMGGDVYRGTARSATTQQVMDLIVKRPFLSPLDRIVIIDDFIAWGHTIKALCDIIDASGATLVGIGAAIEKVFLNGRSQFEREDVPIHSLVRIRKMHPDGTIEFE